MVQPVHREIHFWTEEMKEPPCGTLEDRFEWSDTVEDVTCDECLEALADEGGRLGAPPVDDDDMGRAGAEDQSGR